jgi:SAM-dependent methyltransferase
MTRAIHWISSVDPQNEREIDALQARMATFYRTNTSYYSDIDFATAGWISDPVNQDIARRVLTRSHVLEIGCGAARILDHHPELAARYTGVDFSPSQLEDNRRRHPAATFVQLTSPTILPLANGLFDCVFSNFVLEHAVRPRAYWMNQCGSWAVVAHGSCAARIFWGEVGCRRNAAVFPAALAARNSCVEPSGMRPSPPGTPGSAFPLRAVACDARSTAVNPAPGFSSILSRHASPIHLPRIGMQCT